MVISKSKAILYLLYFIIGIYIFSIDMSAGILYITVFPIFIIMFVNNCKNGNIVFSMIFFYLLCAQGAGSVIFFIEKDNYTKTGWTAIGDFNFSLEEYFKIYVYVFIFILVLYFFSKIASDTVHGNVGLKYISSMLDKSLNSLKTESKYQIYVLFISVLGIILSIYMYSNQIGLVGMNQKALPFHLTGILVYVRRYVLTLLLIYFYIKSKNKTQSVIYIYIYAFFSGIASVSRSVCGMLLVPIIAEAIISKKYSRATLTVVYYAILYSVISELRTYVYSFTFIKYSYIELIGLALQMLGEVDGDFLISFVSGICNRLYSCQSIILASQHDGYTMLDLLHYYLGARYSDIIPNVAEDIYGLFLPSNRSYGVGLGYFGVIVLFSSGRYILGAVNGLIIGIIFLIQEKSIRAEMIAGRGYIKVLCMVGISALSIFLTFINASTSSLYALTTVILIMRYFVK